MRHLCVSLLDCGRFWVAGLHAASAPTPPYKKDLLRIPTAPDENLCSF
jgi:hypothetical protein